MMLFSGTSNPLLAKKIASIFNIPLGNVEITRFIDNECRVYVNDDVAGKRVFVVESLSEIADQHLVELCLFGQVLKDLHAKEVIAVIPWMGYSKQDRAFREGEAVSALLVAKFIEAAGFDRVITCELHSPHILTYFHVPVTTLSTHTLFSPSQGIVVSPDKGGRSRSEIFAKNLKLPVVYCTKKRNGNTVTVTGVSGDVEGKACIIFDDIVNTGETAIKISDFLKNHGANTVSLYATHAVLAGDAAKKLSLSSIDTVTFTDTIAVPKHKISSKFKIVSVAPLLADAIMSS